MTTTTTAQFAPEQAVLINLGVAVKQGFFVEPADREGYLTVRYDTKKGEQFRTVRADKVTALEPQDTDGVDTEPVDDVPVVDVTDERDDEQAPAPTKKAARKTAEPKRAPLPDGFVTPVGLAKVINERGLYTGSRPDGVSPQMVYSAIKAGAGERAFPGQDVNGRLAVEVEAGVAWWVAKNERAARRGVSAKVDRAAVIADLEQALGSDDPVAAVRAVVAALRGDA